MSKLPALTTYQFSPCTLQLLLEAEPKGLVTLAGVRCNIVSLTSVDPRSSASRARLALHSLFEACIGDAARLGLFYRNGELPLIKCLRRIRAIRTNPRHLRVRKQAAQQPNLQGSILGSDAYSMIVFVFMARQSA